MYKQFFSNGLICVRINVEWILRRGDLMRVIAGDFKGRKFKAVPGKLTRPTSDKIKEAAFQIMGPFFQGGICLDLFAGSGSLGIEALSRGMEYAVFIDKQPKAIHTINENVKIMRIEEKTEVLRKDAFRALQIVSKNNASFDLILIDPPYENMDYEKLLIEIMDLQLLSENGLIYCEHMTTTDLPMNLTGLKVIKQTKYGGTTGITIYQKIINNKSDSINNRI